MKQKFMMVLLGRKVNNLNTSRRYPEGMGTTTACLATGGRISPSTQTANTESWNGTNWTEVNNLTLQDKGFRFNRHNNSWTYFWIR